MSLPPLAENERLRLLPSVILAVTEATDLDSGLGVALEKIGETAGWAFGQAWLPHADGLLHCSSHCWYSGMPGLDSFRRLSESFTFAPGVGMPGRAWSRKEPVWVRDVTNDDNFPRAPGARQVGLKTAVGIPILAKTEVVAVIEFFMLDAHDEDEQLVEVIRAIAAELGLVVQRKLAEDKLRASELRLRSLVDSAKDAIISADSGDNIISWNRGAEAIFGYEAKEIVGRPLTVLVPERYREAHRQGLERFRTTGESHVIGRTLELHGLRKDGAEFPCELSVSTWRTTEDQFFTGIIRDTTERNRARENESRLLREQTARLAEQEAASRGEQRFRILALASRSFAEANLELPALLDKVAHHVVEAIGDVCAIRLLVADQEHLELVALRPADPEALALLRNREGQAREKVGDTQSSRVILTGESFVIPVVSPEAFRATVSPQFWPYLDRFGVHSLLAVPLRSHDKIIGSITISRTSPAQPYTLEDQTLLEELSDRAGLAIHNARLHQDLKVAVQAREDFLAIAGHVLKTPLAAMLMQVQSLKRATQKDLTRVAERLAKAESSALRLERLINQLLDVSRITAGRLRLEPEEVNLSEVVKEVVAQFTETNANANYPITVHVDGQAMGRWDRLRIEQVINNLVGNAVKYGRGRPVEVDLDARNGEAILRVIDHGIGIDEEHQKKIFQRFERAVATRDFGGFGLGLWITRQIVEASGGKIEVQSTPGQGSTFTVRLPVKRDGAAPEDGHAHG